MHNSRNSCTFARRNHCEKFRNEKSRNHNYLNMNPFKFGTIVESEYFTDRIEETETLINRLDSENHIVLISPRRYGKSSLVKKVLTQIHRPSITINMQQVLSVQHLAELLLREIFSAYPLEKIKHQLTHFRFVPTVSTNALMGTIDVSFQPQVKAETALEDAMVLLEKVSTQEKRLVVVLDEFQEVLQIQKGLDKQLRAIMQTQKGLNYIFLGSQESMMTDIFEKKKSPFYHFGQLMHLKRIPETDFRAYIAERLPNYVDNSPMVDAILAFTNCHPYYTQQLSAQVWELMAYPRITENVVEIAISKLVQEHDLDYERLWNAQNRTDRGILRQLAFGQNPMTSRTEPSSTTYSGLKRMLKAGLLINESGYTIEDPFFTRWLRSYLS